MDKMSEQVKIGSLSAFARSTGELEEMIIESPLTPKRRLWRVYFNRREDFPFLAAVDNGTIASQIRVQSVRTESIPWANSRTDMGPKPELERNTFYPPGEISLRDQRKGRPNEPTWWMEFEAYAVFENGGVTFYGEKA